jgi:23S rRNA (guanosine2251-2'-O)-methyltransferase
MIQLEGKNPVSEALHGDRLNRILVSRSGLDNPDVKEIIGRARESGIPVNLVSSKRLDSLSTTGHHQGIMGYARPPTEWSLERILVETGREVCILLLDGIQDPHNLGAILRTCEASGVDAIVIPKRGSVEVTPTVHRVSMGGSIYVPVFKRSFYPVVKLLHDEGLEIIALDPSGEIPYYEERLMGAVALVLGGEDTGISPTLLDKCDKVVHIPMLGNLNSLNVSVATGVVLYERVRQMMGSR